MVAENAFLAAVAAFLQGRSDLAPAAAGIGVAEPAAAAELPAVVLSLEEIRRGRDGLGPEPPGAGVVRLSGVLRVDVCAPAAADAAGLSTGVVEALLSPAALAGIARLVSLDLAQLGSVGVPEAGAAQGRRRAARFRFEFEQEVERPAPDEGVLKTVTVGIDSEPKTFSVGQP
jgi:hypothetical protein